RSAQRGCTVFPLVWSPFHCWNQLLFFPALKSRQQQNLPEGILDLKLHQIHRKHFSRLRCAPFLQFLPAPCFYRRLLCIVLSFFLFFRKRSKHTKDRQNHLHLRGLGGRER